MKKKWTALALLLGLLLAASSWAGEMGAYKSKDGWSVSYDQAVFEALEEEEGVCFRYAGPGVGLCQVEISVLGEKDPAKALYEATLDWEEGEIRRLEGYLTGTRDKWCYHRILTSAEDESLSRMATAAEYNGKVFLMEITTHTGDNASDNLQMGKAISGVLDGIAFTSYQPQLQFASVPGSYVHKEGKKDECRVVLREDHSGTLELTEEVKIHWGSLSLTTDDGLSSFPYSLKKDTLTLEVEGEEITFKREKEEDLQEEKETEEKSKDKKETEEKSKDKKETEEKSKDKKETEEKSQEKEEKETEEKSKDKSKKKKDKENTETEDTTQAEVEEQAEETTEGAEKKKDKTQE